MNSIQLLLLGMILVLGSILWLRLHAFLALILGALAIAFLTPKSSLERFAQSEFLRTNQEATAATSLPAITKAANALTSKTPATRVAEGFGATCTKVGILIAMASVIGVCLLESGAAQQIVNAILACLGAARAHFAFLFSGFFLAIPVFFDTVFYLLIPIGKAMRRKTGKNYLLYILTIVAGGTMAHSLVPPTPGPMFVASELGVSLATMMLAGVIVGSFAVAFGYGWAVWMNKRYEIPLREEADDSTTIQAIESRALPPTFLALLPIVIPVILLAVGSISAAQVPDDQSPALLISLLKDKNLALVFGAAVGLLLLARYGAQNRDQARDHVQRALQSGASIILITAAGGAFGSVLKQTGIAPDIAAMLGSSASWLALPVVFLVTVIVRTAQGSATVAMITAVPVAAAFVSQVGCHPVYLALAIGCGSKPIPWMNDSGFWIVTRMSGMKESETLRFVTPMMSLMGLVGFLVTLLGAWLFPMAS